MKKIGIFVPLFVLCSCMITKSTGIPKGQPTRTFELENRYEKPIYFAFVTKPAKQRKIGLKRLKSNQKHQQKFDPTEEYILYIILNSSKKNVYTFPKGKHIYVYVNEKGNLRSMANLLAQDKEIKQFEFKGNLTMDKRKPLMMPVIDEEPLPAECLIIKS